MHTARCIGSVAGRRLFGDAICRSGPRQVVGRRRAAPDDGLSFGRQADGGWATPGTLVSPRGLRPHTSVGATGEFSFQSYVAHDGVEPGTYIVTFAKLRKRDSSLVGPDGFQNLYNDAERNQQQYPELKIEHHAPGKKDYIFDLKIAGRE